MCDACGDAHLFLHAALAAVDRRLAAKEAADGWYAGETVSGDDPTIADEVALAAALAAAFHAASAKLRADLALAALSGRTADAEAALSRHAQTMNAAWASAEADVRSALASAVRSGIAGVAGSTPPKASLGTGVLSPVAAGLVGQGDSGVQRLYEGAVRQALEAAKRHYGERLGPALSAAFARALEADTLDAFAASLERRCRSAEYFLTVANAAVGRAHNGAAVYAMRETGVATYRFVATLDGRTSAVCRSLNGREWSVADAAARLDAAGLSDSPAALVDAFPFPDDARAPVEGAPPPLPPLHHRCRSRVVAVR